MNESPTFTPLTLQDAEWYRANAISNMWTSMKHCLNDDPAIWVEDQAVGREDLEDDARRKGYELHHTQAAENGEPEGLGTLANRTETMEGQ